MSARPFVDDRDQRDTGPDSPASPRAEAPQAPTRRGTLNLGQVAGIEVRVRYTWLIFALVTFVLTVGYLPATLPNAPFEAMS
jgi:hypothetical protein